MSKIKIYKASAGSGKTYTLALEYIRELLIHYNNDAYRSILAVTFTKDATGEMKDRILAELFGLAFNTDDSAGFLNNLQQKLKADGFSMDTGLIREKSKQVLYAILHDYSRLNITTIDSFFQKVLRNLARELGTGSKFNLEMNTENVLSEAVHATIEKANQNKQVLDWLTTYIEQKMEDGNWRIEQDVFQFSRCIYNEFFQENEKILHRQIKDNPNLFNDLKKHQNQIKAETKRFFLQTYQTVQALLEAHQLETDDFIRKGLPIVFFQKLATGNIKTDVSATVKNCSETSEAWTAQKHHRRIEIMQLADNELIPLLQKTLKKQIVWLTSKMITDNLHQLGLIWNITQEIESQNTENNRFMLSDTGRFLNDMIDDSDAPFIYEKIGADIQHVMIDEFQDTSRLQWQNFKSLLSNIIANNQFSLIVGDVKQAIYRWRNGDWRILNDIDKELNATIENLDTNYRSDKNIVDFNNTFFPYAAKQLNQLYINKLDSDKPSPFLSAYNEENLVQSSIKPEGSGFVSIDLIETEDDERKMDAMLRAVFNKIQHLYENQVPADEICILTRKNSEITALADYLASLKNEFPEMAQKHYLSVISDEAFQLKSSEAISVLIAALKTIADSEDSLWNYELGIRNYELQNANNELNKMPLFELVGYLYRHLHLGKIEGQSAYLFAFYDAMTAYLNDRPTDIPQFLRYWEEDLQNRTIPAGSNVAGVRAMTVHKSKGLQFSTVILPYCDWKINPQFNPVLWCGPKESVCDLALLPVNYTSAMEETVFAPEYKAETVQAWMDTLNLLYVAFTRAEKNLLIIGSFKKKLDSVDAVVTVSNLMQLFGNESYGNWNDEKKCFEIGTIGRKPENRKSENANQNILKINPLSKEAHFVSNEFQTGKSIFKQSNQSREFVSQESDKKANYVSYGNVMHYLFERITHIESIEKAVNQAVLEGLISIREKERYVQNICSAIEESNVNHWFDGTYKSYQEHSIITEEAGEIVSKRPDRVLLSENETIVIDYKLGQEHHSHQKQVRQYMDLLRKMQYPKVHGFLWYVEERRLVEME